LAEGWDISFNYLRSWRDLPLYRSMLVFSPEARSPVFEIRPFYQRISTWGGSFSRPLGSMLVRGEFSYVPGLLFESSDPRAAGMLARGDFLTYFLGADFRVHRLRLGFQFAQEIIFGSGSYLNRKKVDNVLTLLVERTFIHDALRCVVFADGEFNQRDLWLKAECDYRLSDRFKLTLGTHIFTGSKQGRLGRLHHWSNAFLKIRYSFSV